MKKTKIVFVALGSPTAPTPKALRSYLKEFLSDRRVIDINPVLWKIILYLFILPFRPKKSAQLYARIWDGKTFPLPKLTLELVEKLRKINKNDEAIEYEAAFLLSTPSVKNVWDKWENEERSKRATDLMVVPLFPQYSESTIASGVDGLCHLLSTKVEFPQLRIVTRFHRLKAFIDLSAENIRKTIDKSGEKIDIILFTFHGIQKRRVIEKQDPYYFESYETYYLIKEKLRDLNILTMVTFQSRFGSEEWLTPYTEDTVKDLITNQKIKNIVVYSPSFVTDCLETIDELGHELTHTAEECGGKLWVTPSVNAQDEWCIAVHEWMKAEVLGAESDRSKLFYQDTDIDYKEFNVMKAAELKMKTPPLSSETKSTLKIVFLTIFLDLVGFSIIFPLFPALSKHYLAVDADNVFLKFIYQMMGGLANLIGTQSSSASLLSGVVLFGGILGALYSFLQFIGAPIWGSLSDRYGRRPILLISIIGMALSYFLWIFSKSFTLLIAARAIGGIMGGNISTATAVVSDITTKENRSKGMAVIGIAFALGFIIGPSIGGILSLVHLENIFPGFGFNPFSAPALLAFVLCLFNSVLVFRKFKETLPEKFDDERAIRSANPFAIFKLLPYQGVNLVNFGHFLFLTAFSGMEFTLTFLAAERLSYTSMQNAYLFIFIGLILTIVQGGLVRRYAHKVGEKKMVIIGLFLLMPGLLLIAAAHTSFVLYSGLFFLAVGSSMIIPCYTALVTMFTPAHEQGRSIGIFRSLGALARVIGPLFASIVYFKSGSHAPYIVGTIFLLIPIFLTIKLPQVKMEN